MTRYSPLWQQANAYPAQLDRALFSALWPAGGVSTGGVVTAVPNTMDVSIAPGFAAVPLAPGQGSALCRWDAAEIVTLAAAPGAGQSRIDVVIAQVRDAQIDGGGNNDFVFAAVTGAPAASNPVAPAVPPNALALGAVTVPGAAANLNAAAIVNAAPGSLGVDDRPAGRVWTNTAGGMVNGWAVFGCTQVSYLRGGMIAGGSPAGLVIPVAGLYEIRGLFTITGFGAAGAGAMGGVYRNGAQFLNGSAMAAGSGFTMYQSSVTADVRPLAAGDTLTAACSWNGSGAGPSTVQGERFSWLAAYRIGASS